MRNVGKETRDLGDPARHDLFTAQKLGSKDVATGDKRLGVLGRLTVGRFGGRGRYDALGVLGELSDCGEDRLVGSDLSEGLEHAVGEVDHSRRGSEFGQFEKRQGGDRGEHGHLLCSDSGDVPVDKRTPVVRHGLVDLVVEIDVDVGGSGRIEALVFFIALVDDGLRGNLVRAGFAEDGVEKVERGVVALLDGGVRARALLNEDAGADERHHDLALFLSEALRALARDEEGPGEIEFGSLDDVAAGVSARGRAGNNLAAVSTGEGVGVVSVFGLTETAQGIPRLVAECRDPFVGSRVHDVLGDLTGVSEHAGVAHEHVAELRDLFVKVGCERLEGCMEGEPGQGRAD